MTSQSWCLSVRTGQTKLKDGKSSEYAQHSPLRSILHDRSVLGENGDIESFMEGRLDAVRMRTLKSVFRLQFFHPSESPIPQTFLERLRVLPTSVLQCSQQGTTNTTSVCCTRSLDTMSSPRALTRPFAISLLFFHGNRLAATHIAGAPPARFHLSRFTSQASRGKPKRGPLVPSYIALPNSFHPAPLHQQPRLVPQLPVPPPPSDLSCDIHSLQPGFPPRCGCRCCSLCWAWWPLAVTASKNTYLR